MTRTRLIALTFAALATSLGAQAAGLVQVSFANPDRFADVRDARLDATANLERLKVVLQEAAAPYVADGQTLKIEVTDVDLAGEVRMSRRLNDVRVLRGSADWPRIELRYTLQAAGKADRSGQARVQDMAYLQRPATVYGGEALAYERRMLEQWFKAEFGGAAH